jgi:hypothetical protein
LVFHKSEVVGWDDQPSDEWRGMTAAAHRTVTVAHLVLAVVNLVFNAPAETTANNHVNLIDDSDMKKSPVRL